MVAMDEVVEGEDNRRSLLTKRKSRKRYSEEEVKAFLDDARAADGRTIQELAQEVRRLVALLPRPLIDEESLPSSTVPISIDNLSHEETENRKTADSLELETKKAVDIAEQEREERMQARDRKGWTYLAFFAMTLVVIIFTFVQLIQALRRTQDRPNAD